MIRIPESFLLPIVKAALAGNKQQLRLKVESLAEWMRSEGNDNYAQELYNALEGK